MLVLFMIIKVLHLVLHKKSKATSVYKFPLTCILSHLLRGSCNILYVYVYVSIHRGIVLLSIIIISIITLVLFFHALAMCRDLQQCALSGRHLHVLEIVVHRHFGHIEFFSAVCWSVNFANISYPRVGVLRMCTRTKCRYYDKVQVHTVNHRGIEY